MYGMPFNTVPPIICVSAVLFVTKSEVWRVLICRLLREGGIVGHHRAECRGRRWGHSGRLLSHVVDCLVWDRWLHCHHQLCEVNQSWGRLPCQWGGWALYQCGMQATSGAWPEADGRIVLCIPAIKPFIVLARVACQLCMGPGLPHVALVCESLTLPPCV
jgi:hypothetical protein